MEVGQPERLRETLFHEVSLLPPNRCQLNLGPLVNRGVPSRLLEKQRLLQTRSLWKVTKVSDPRKSEKLKAYMEQFSFVADNAPRHALIFTQALDQIQINILPLAVFGEFAIKILFLLKVRSM